MHINIEFGSIFGESIAPMFKYGSKNYLTIVKLHSKNPLIDGVQFL